MPTRFYLPSTGAAEVTPANDAWDKTTGAGAARAAVRTRISSAMATVTNTKDNTTLHSALIRQYVTEPLGAQTITGNVSGAMRCIESNAGFSACVAVSIRACSQDGGTIRSPALLAISNSDLYTSTTVHEMATTLTNRLLEDVNEDTTIGLTSCTLSDGDRLVFEFGFRSSDTSTTRTGGISFGDNSATDLSSTDTTVVTANNPWIEFDSVLSFNRSLAISGPTQGTGEIESPVAEHTATASGEAGTGSVQGAAASTDITPPDFEATASAGDVTVFIQDITRPLTGEQGTSEVAAAGANLETSATGDGATASIESLEPSSVSASIALDPAGSAIETLTAANEASVASSELSASLDSVSAAHSADVGGSTVTAETSPVEHQIISSATTGIEAAGAIEPATSSGDFALAGLAITGALGTVVAPGSAQQAISGEMAAGAVHDVGLDASAEIGGTGADSSVGDLSEETLVAVEGIEAVSDFGLIQVDTGGPVELLSGILGASAVGDLRATSLYWRGKFWSDTPVDGPWTETPIMQRE